MMAGERKMSMSRAEQSTKLVLDRIIFIGRSFDEYLKMFSLSQGDLTGKKILDCPAGACSFTAIGLKRGLDVTACDIAYCHSIEDLRSKGLKDIEHAVKNMKNTKELYQWEYFKDIEGLRDHRLSALTDSLTSMTSDSERYVQANLPSLPFKDGEFDLVLSAHFLFLYADRLDYEFHLNTLLELLRVSSEEVRLFPLVDLEGKRYEHLGKIVSFLKEKGYIVEEQEVEYEFQANAHSMLKIKEQNKKVL